MTPIPPAPSSSAAAGPRRAVPLPASLPGAGRAGRPGADGGQRHHYRAQAARRPGQRFADRRRGPAAAPGARPAGSPARFGKPAVQRRRHVPAGHQRSRHVQRAHPGAGGRPADLHLVRGHRPFRLRPRLGAGGEHRAHRGGTRTDVLALRFGSPRRSGERDHPARHRYLDGQRPARWRRARGRPRRAEPPARRLSRRAAGPRQAGPRPERREPPPAGNPGRRRAPALRAGRRQRRQRRAEPQLDPGRRPAHRPRPPARARTTLAQQRDRGRARATTSRAT